MEIFLKRIWDTNNLTSDTMLKWKDMQISYIPINLEDMRSIADIPTLYSIEFSLDIKKQEGSESLRDILSFAEQKKFKKERHININKSK